MGVLNRNIITAQDVAALKSEPYDQMPKTFQECPPAGALPLAYLVQPPAAAPAPPAAAAAPAGATPSRPDDYLAKLLKYIPAEILGIYLLFESVVRSNVKDADDLQVWLLAVLLGMVALTAVYSRAVLNVVRSGQLMMSMLGLAVYVFSMGGWFATTSWYEPFHATFAVVLFVLLVGVVKLSPLPVVSTNPKQLAPQ